MVIVFAIPVQEKYFLVDLYLFCAFRRFNLAFLHLQLPKLRNFFSNHLFAPKFSEIFMSFFQIIEIEICWLSAISECDSASINTNLKFWLLSVFTILFSLWIGDHNNYQACIFYRFGSVSQFLLHSINIF
jgi:hypothetical protein